jgi:hypothetical protein
MPASLRLVLTLHNHQPVGNFDAVIEQIYRDSYLPFLQVFSRYPSLRISLHTSGPLLEWLAARHPEYLDRLAELAQAGRIEILGGAFYEPILPSIPRRDRRRQIERMNGWLEERFGRPPLGMWLPERVWEQSLASDLAASGIEHIVLDDFHFTSAGLTEDQLHGYYLTEDEGRMIAVFPGSERLRYLIPFAEPEETIAYLRSIAQSHPGGVVVFGDDGEKFGAWPGMQQHVFQEKWLTRFFDVLAANSDWLQTTTLAESVNHVAPLGNIYLPDGSYREMIEWSSLGEAVTINDKAGRSVPRAAWRNFRVKYPEVNEMYARMLGISHRLQRAVKAGRRSDLVEAARQELYRGQCNDAYWHGTFGGVYLPHLRQAVFQHLIAADNLLDQADGREGPWVEATIQDLNVDVHKEVMLANDKLVALVSPYRGGQIYEFDVRNICRNLLATMARRPETYHATAQMPENNIAAGYAGKGNGWASMEPASLLQYDPHARKSLMDHFFDRDTTLADVMAGQANERGDFVDGHYEARLRQDPQRICVQLARQGKAAGRTIRIVKGVTLAAGGSELEVDYLLSGLPADQIFHFGVEMNFAGLPVGCADRYFRDGRRQTLGQLGEQLNLSKTKGLCLVDDWLGLEVDLKLSRASSLWTFPIETVSRTVTGLESIQQSVVVMPHWLVKADVKGCWRVTMKLQIDTSAAERRQTGTRPRQDRSELPRRARLPAAA